MLHRVPPALGLAVAALLVGSPLTAMSAAGSAGPGAGTIPGMEALEGAAEAERSAEHGLMPVGSAFDAAESENEDQEETSDAPKDDEDAPPADLGDLGLDDAPPPDDLGDLGLDDSPPPDDLGDLGLDDLSDFDLGDFEIEDELALLYAEDIVVSATRHEQRISESPSAITVISREELRGGWHRDISDVLRMVPGGDVYRINPMSVNVGIRAGTTGIANRVLLLVDGRDLALHTNGQPQWNALPFDLESIERIEVIRGPGSSIYGANAFQGVVNVITRSPTSEPLAVEGTASVAGPLTYTADARVHGTKGGLRWWVNAGYDRESVFEAPDVLGYESRRARGLVSLDLGDELEGTVEAGYGDAAGRFAAPVGDGPASWSTPYLMGRLRSPSAEVQLTFESSGVHAAPEQEIAAPPGTIGDEPLYLGSVAPLDLESRSAELTGFHSFTWPGGHRIMAGGTGRLIHHLKGAVLECPDVPVADFDLEHCDDASLLELRGGVFAQAEIALTDTLGLTAGARTDANNIHPELGLSPRLAMVWAPIEGQALRASAGRAYRKPSFLESYLNLRFQAADGVPGEIASRLEHLLAVGSPNPDLRNETVDAIEMGWLGRFLNGRLITSLDLYGMRFDDRMEGVIENLEFEEGFGGLRIRQDARVTYRNRDHHQWSIGGEAAVTARPARWLRLDAHYNHQGVYNSLENEDGEIVSERCAWTPRHRANLAARIDLPRGLRLASSVHWSSKYTKYLQDPESVLYEPTFDEVGNDFLVLGSASYMFSIAGSPLEVGVAGRNFLFSEIREIPGISREEGPWGGEVLAPQARLFLRGSF